MWNSKPVIAVFGSSQITDGDDEYRQARLLGRLLARSGFVVCNGGYGGVMEATSRGVSEMEGVSIGLTLDAFDVKGANPFLTRELRSPTLFERLAHFVDLAEAFVVLRGGVGTLSEFATVWNLMQTRQLDLKPFIFLGHCWPRTIENLRQDMEIRDKDVKLLHIVSTPEQALEILKRHIHTKS